MLPGCINIMLSRYDCFKCCLHFIGNSSLNTYSFNLPAVLVVTRLAQSALYLELAGCSRHSSGNIILHFCNSALINFRCVIKANLVLCIARQITFLGEQQGSACTEVLERGRLPSITVWTWQSRQRQWAQIYFVSSDPIGPRAEYRTCEFKQFSKHLQPILLCIICNDTL